MVVRNRLLNGLSAIAGLWVFFSLAYFDFSTTAFWLNVVTGGAVIIAGGFGATRTISDRERLFASIMAGVLGLVLIALSFILALSGIAFWSNVVSGAVVAVLSGAAAVVTRTGERTRTPAVGA